MHRKTCAWFFCALSAFTLGFHALHGAESEARKSPGKLSPAEAARTFRVPPGFTTEVVASEPLLQNPVSFSFDSNGDVYVVETHRRRTSVFDIRNFPEWLDADYSFNSVEDRFRFFQQQINLTNKVLIEKLTKRSGPNSFRDFNGDGVLTWQDLSVESERIRFLRDGNSDGIFDSATTFAEGFNSPVSGVAAGVLIQDDQVWFACIPDLWWLKDTNRDGVADERRKLHTGFGVHIAFGGHDMHGLTWGPDGRLYWSIADRGAYVVSTNGSVLIDRPHDGAIFRSNPDGSDLELVAYGLRNPQELAFDDYGNLWTGENNADGGDKARLVYVMPGSDSGWRIGWQWLPKLGAWNSERLWHTNGANTASYILPPISYVGRGPSGLSFYPGVGLPERYKDHFFMCDFPDGVRSFAVRPKEAGFEMYDDHQFVGGIFAVDCDFSRTPGLYLLDWVEGWDKTGKGRIYRVFSQETPTTKSLNPAEVVQSSLSKLEECLTNADRRVRLAAQFELARRGDVGVEILQRATAGAQPLLKRIHGLWGLGQALANPGKQQPKIEQTILQSLGDGDAEIRAQAARICGDRRVLASGPALVRQLSDASLRVGSLAAVALGQVGYKPAVPALVKAVEENGWRDPYLAHGLVMGMQGTAQLEQLVSLTNAPATVVRMTALQVLRRRTNDAVRHFLHDPDAGIVLEAARAIHDVPIESAGEALARLPVAHLQRLPSETREFVLRRVLAANFRLPDSSAAERIGQILRQSELATQVEAAELLGQWTEPPRRDPVTGLWNFIPNRNSEPARKIVVDYLREILPRSTTDLSLGRALITAAGKLKAVELTETFLQVVREDKHPLRKEVLLPLSDWNVAGLEDLLVQGSRSSDVAFRQEAFRLLDLKFPNRSREMADRIASSGTVVEKQTLLSNLQPGPAAETLIGDWLKKPDLDPALALEFEEAVKRLKNDPLSKQWSEVRKAFGTTGLKPNETLLLHGGDAERGRRIFFERQDVACFRCHSIKGQGGQVGPDLGDIGAHHDRKFILESIIYPNREIEEGYENVQLELKDGTTVAGQVKKESDTTLEVLTGEDGLRTITKSEISQRQRGPSAMIEDIGSILSPGELRDLVEFLARQK